MLSALGDDDLRCVCDAALCLPAREVARIATTCSTFHRLLREDLALLRTLAQKAIGGARKIGQANELLLTNKGLTGPECERIGRYGAQGVLRGLATLSIAFNAIDDQVMRAFATPRWGAWPSLQQLILNGNQIGCDGVIALATAVRCGGGAWDQLRSLNLSYNRIGDRGRVALAEGLELRHASAGASAAGSSYIYLPALGVLLLMGNVVGLVCDVRLKSARPFDELRLLD